MVSSGSRAASPFGMSWRPPWSCFKQLKGRQRAHVLEALSVLHGGGHGGAAGRHLRIQHPQRRQHVHACTRIIMRIGKRLFGIRHHQWLCLHPQRRRHVHACMRDTGLACTPGISTFEASAALAGHDDAYRCTTSPHHICPVFLDQFRAPSDTPGHPTHHTGCLLTSWRRHGGADAHWGPSSLDADAHNAFSLQAVGLTHDLLDLGAVEQRLRRRQHRLGKRNHTASATVTAACAAHCALEQVSARKHCSTMGLSLSAPV